MAPRAPAVVPPAPLKIAEGTVIADKYRLDRPLSRGAMGSVWVATHLALETHVAIKFIATLAAGEKDNASAPAGHGGQDGDSPSSTPSQKVERSRFEREAKAAAQIRSTNVVQILDYGVDRDTPYLVMELLHGEDLGARLKRVEKMALADVSTLVTAVARALRRAHEAGLVHRDLKPANIFLAREGDDEVPKVLDFGVAKAVKSHRADESTIEGTLVGTPSYMSPEQAMGRSAVDHRSDLWSLGVIAYRALTGVRPFHSESLLEVVVKICSEPHVPPSELVAGLPPGIDAFFEKALERDVTKRFQSAKEMARALAALGPRRSSSLPPKASRPPTHGATADAALDVPVDIVGGDATIVNPQAPAVPQLRAGAESDPEFLAGLPSSPSFDTSAGVVAPPSRQVDAPLDDDAAGVPRRNRALPLALGAGAIVLVLLGVAVAVSRGRSPAPDDTSARAKSAEGKPAEPRHEEGNAAAPTPPDKPAEARPADTSPAPTTSAAVAPAPTASAAAAKKPAEPTATTADTASARAAPRTSPPPRPGAAKVDCSTPFYWDSNGTKHIKPECL